MYKSNHYRYNNNSKNKIQNLTPNNRMEKYMVVYSCSGVLVVMKYAYI